MNFEIAEFLSASVDGIPLVLPILILVFLMKKGGVSGNALTYSSFGIGLLFGVFYQLSVLGIPTSFAGYFAFATYGITLGGLTAKFHDYLKDTQFAKFLD